MEDDYNEDYSEEDDEMVMAFLRALYERETVEFIDPVKMQILNEIVDAIVNPIRENEDAEATFEIVHSPLFRSDITIEIIASGASWLPDEFSKLLCYSEYLRSVSVMPRLDGKIMILFGIGGLKEVFEVE